MSVKENKRLFGEHLTSSLIFNEFIFPEIQNSLNNYTWIDLYAGEGHLIFPIIERIQKEKREDFFSSHIFLSDIQEKMVQSCLERAVDLGISKKVAHQNVVLRDNLESFPKGLLKFRYPLFHITNPPYLYLGYIRKHKSTQKYLPYFEDANDGYQDLYQIALINDLRNNLSNLIYLIPSNFLFGAAVSNKIRKDFLKYYAIRKVVVLEKQIFEYTGMNICICFFNRKKTPKEETQMFRGIKIKKQNQIIKKNYTLKPEFKYRAGSEFEEFLRNKRANVPLTVRYYLLNEDVSKNRGKNELSVIDANNYNNGEYKKLTIKVSNVLENQIKSNILYVKTVDSGSEEGRVGIGFVRDDFNVDGILVTGNTYRTHPIQIFLDPPLSIENQTYLKQYFNLILEYFRDYLDSEFLTTYKYSNAEYTRKYLGLTQVRGLIETFPILSWDEIKTKKLYKIIRNKDMKALVNFL